MQTILDWRPFDYFTIDDRSSASTSDRPELMMTYQLVPTAGGTQLNVHLQMPMPAPAPVRRTLVTGMMKLMKVEQNYRNLERIIAQEQEKVTSLQVLA